MSQGFADFAFCAAAVVRMAWSELTTCLPFFWAFLSPKTKVINRASLLSRSWCVWLGWNCCWDLTAGDSVLCARFCPTAETSPCLHSAFDAFRVVLLNHRLVLMWKRPRVWYVSSPLLLPAVTLTILSLKNQLNSTSLAQAVSWAPWAEWVSVCSTVKLCAVNLHVCFNNTSAVQPAYHSALCFLTNDKPHTHHCSQHHAWVDCLTDK